jgi:PAS domain S-box-containing protein
VHIVSVLVQLPGEDERIIPVSGPEIEIPDTAQRIEIRCMVVAVGASSRIRTQYRLNGDEAGWVDLRALRNVGFSSLPPGDYRFQIRAAIGRSNWSTPADLRFSVVAPIWRTAWLPMLVGLGLALISGAVVYGVQASKIRRTTGELRRLEAIAQKRLRSELLVEQTSDLVCFARPDGEVVSLNRAGFQLLGYDPSQPPPSDLAVVLSSSAHRCLRAAWDEAERTGLWSAETALRHRTGAEIPVLLVAVFQKSDSGETTLVAITARDVTEGRRVEQDLRHLSAHRATTLEEERKRISREIHDELGQQLTALKHGLAMLEPRPSLSPDARVSNLIHQTDTAIQTVRRIATELRPAVLDHFGLCAAVEWLAGDMAKKGGMRHTCTLPAEFKPSQELSTTVFRIVQEALTNVVRHSGASRVDVRMEVSPSALVVSVTDNGRGLPSESLKRPISLGLLGMRERAAALGGHVEILPNNPSGTTMQALFPLTLVSAGNPDRS